MANNIGEKNHKIAWPDSLRSLVVNPCVELAKKFIWLFS